MSPEHEPTISDRRRNAEQRLSRQQPEPAPDRTAAVNQRLVHELQVHQIELEMQNEELRDARNEIEAGLEKYSILYDFAPVGFLTLDRGGLIHEANFAAANLFEINRSRLVKRRLELLIHQADRTKFTAFLSAIFDTKVRQACEVTLFKEGEPPVEVRIEAAVAASGRECRAVLQDITERKRAERDRLTLNKLESTGILAGGVAHDFNNLLTVILLDLELARAVVPPGEEWMALRKYLEDARSAAMAAGGLTQQLISFATAGAPIRKPTNLPGLVQEWTRLVLSGSALECEFSLADDLWWVEVDEGQISQVIRNMVLNAREAMHESGTISIRLENLILGPSEMPLLTPGHNVRISIRDRGDGIAEEVLPKIFDPYFSTKRRGAKKGMGLGLTICHAVIQRHLGAITVDSVVGVGTTFHIYLPACPKLPGEEKTTVPAVKTGTGRGTGRILGQVLDN